MITVTNPPGTKVLLLKCHFAYKDRIKRLPGAQFDWDEKVWWIPQGSLGALLSAFPGELYFKTPLWQITGEPKPPFPQKRRYYPVPIKLPEIKLPPYKYQEWGAQVMVDRILHYGFVINADDVGLGKTLQTILAMRWLMKHEGVKKILIICKKSIKYQWKSEIEKFTGFSEKTMPILITKDGTKKQRNRVYDEFKGLEKGILITNYHNYLNDADDIRACSFFDFIIIDEVHTLKNRNGKINNNIAKVTRGNRVALLTGTPIMSRPDDIYGILQLATYGYFGSFQEFKNRYLVYDPNVPPYQKAAVIGAKNLGELGNAIQDIMIRREADDVSIELPEVMEENLYTSMDDTQKKILEMIDRRRADLESEKESMIEGGRVKEDKKDDYAMLCEIENMFLAAMQYAADDPRVFALGSETKLNKAAAALVPKGYKMSAKTEMTLDLVESIIDAGKKVIIFGKLATPLKMLAEDIEKTVNQPVLIYTGEQNDEDRARAVDLFTRTDSYNILIGNEAMAEGLNLQAANYMIQYEQADNFAIKSQRIGRIRRAKSEHRHAHVYNIITEGSWDEDRLAIIERTGDTAGSLVG